MPLRLPKSNAIPTRLAGLCGYQVAGPEKARTISRLRFFARIGSHARERAVGAQPVVPAARGGRLASCFTPRLRWRGAFEAGPRA